MGQVKEGNIKNQTYPFFNDMINIKNFLSNLQKIDKKLYKDLIFIIYLLVYIYYTGYITIKKFGDCEKIHSVISLHLIIHSATRHLKKKKMKNT